MRRSAITKLNLDQVDLRRKPLTVVEKGGYDYTDQISREGIQTVQDYLTQERDLDAARWPSPALFLAAATVPRSIGRLTVASIPSGVLCVGWHRWRSARPIVPGMPWANIF
jgi:site-specific recombinase XerD